MTSTIEGTIRDGVRIKDIFSSLFPCGSVTGAPKIKTMEIIKELEKEARGIYTGAIGYISPRKDVCFNVAIRTVSLKNGKGEMGIGGGIVYDSLEKSEFEEALLKAKFLTEKFPQFSLIESILWEKNEGYAFLSLHLRRLRNSCRYFAVPLDCAKLRENLRMLEKGIARGKWKVRIAVSLEGEIHIDSEPLDEVKTPVKVKMSTRRINPQNVFLYHKTTRRDWYERERNKAVEEGFFDVIFLNNHEEITEGAITNIFALKGGRLYTPPVKCGLLGGVLREHLLREGKAQEKILHLEDISEADKLYIGNSVRGLLEAELWH